MDAVNGVGRRAPGAASQVALFAGAAAALLLTVPMIGVLLAAIVVYLAFRLHARTLLVATTLLLVGYAAFLALTLPV